MVEKTKQISLRLPEEEVQILEKYCDKTKRTKTDVIRSFIRRLKNKLA